MNMFPHRESKYTLFK